MRNILPVIAVVLLLGACQESLDKRYAREAKDYTSKYCPAPVAENTIMDSMTFNAADRSVNYYFTLQNKLDDAVLLDTMKTAIEDDMLASIKSSTNLKQYKDAGLTFNYIYRSEKTPGKTILELKITEKDYK